MPGEGGGCSFHPQDFVLGWDFQCERGKSSFSFKSLLADISLPLWPCLGGFPTLHPKFLFCSFLSGQSPSLGLCPLLLLQWQCQPDASLSDLTPPRCGWGLLIFWVFAFLLHLPCGLQVFPSLPSHCQGSIFSFLFISILFSSAVSISPMPYAFRFLARSFGWISAPSQEKTPNKPFSCPSATQILLQLLGLALHHPLLPEHNSTH